MQYDDTQTTLIACRQLALEQNQKLFDQANAISREAFELLDHPDFDSEMFDQYLHLRAKAESLFKEAIEHLSVLHTHFSPLSSPVAPVANANKEAA
ncbi:hypothetical protein YA0871_09620 [Pseudomonas paralactis]|uniref:Lipoprotein n=1 Tax=Pseudomonas paralactis TaxID=1615673 RepID=A0ABS0UY18_9PSED|nr:hypothetical protein [Pseudomonas paralactis]MBI6632922.1 hypothetical protein [Pseudomonas paralactis]